MPETRPDVVDPTLAQYIAEHSSRPDDVQRSLMTATEERTGGAHIMQIGGDQGTFIEMLVRAMNARLVVEVGTFTGYSALSIARGLPDGGRLICCDVNEQWTAIGREHWEMAGLASRIDLRIGPAADTLRELPLDDPIDLAFIDADKTGYATYFDELLQRLRPGGLILVDNTLWSGKVIDHSVTDRDTEALRQFNRYVADHPGVRLTIVPMGDGVTVIQKR
jgi:caffeoyl-CoA O-methyltransferase